MSATRFVHEHLTGLVGSVTTVTGTVGSFLAAANPVLQFVSLVISIVVGVLTIIHFIKKHSK